MDFNTFLIRLGIDPSNFINKYSEPIKTDNGFIYEVEQRKDIRICPYCNNSHTIINDYDYVEINCSETDYMKDILRIKKVRFKCKDCNKTFTPDINGISKYSKISDQTIDMIVNDFYKMLSFEQIAQKYHLTRQRILQIFDEKIIFVPRKKMPFVLCIDEIRFKEEYNQNYCCVLYDFDNKYIVDIVKNRQLPYLEEYFSSIPENERNHTKYFVSDMYDSYRTIRRKYFPKAIHIIDLFHVVCQLARAVNKIRVIAMKSLNQGSIEYRFMKSYWKLFLCRKEDIPDKIYEDKKTLKDYHFDDLVFKCCLKDNRLLEAYNILQDLYHYNQKYTFNDAHKFINYIADRLSLTESEILIDVANTYRKWSVEIANGLAKSQTGKHYTNGIAESINNLLKTIIKTAYGYKNFIRFRKRAMLIITYKKNVR